MSIQSLWRIVLGLTLVLGFTACGNDPVTPEDETLNKLHEDPASARLTFETVRYDSTTHTYTRQPFAGAPEKQVVTYTIANGQWKATGDTIIKALPYDSATPVSYLLHIAYFNAKGTNISYQFVTNGQDVIHQHFFMPNNVYINNALRYDLRRTNALYRYTYLDTTPYDKEPGTAGASLIGLTNPIGFRGVFQFTQPHSRFDMDIWLLHSLNTQRGKYLNDARTEMAPYYVFNKAQAAGGAWDINVPVAIQVQ